jgi:dipeptidyl-peptidase-4
VTLEFMREIMMFAAEHRAKIIQIHDRARRETIASGQNPQPDDVVGLRHRVAAHHHPVTIKGYEKLAGGEGGAAIDPHVDHGPPKDYPCVHLCRFEPTLSVRRPPGYIVPPECENVVDNLRAHGVEVEPFEGEAVVEVYAIDRIEQVGRPFQNHTPIRLETTARCQRRTFQAGSFLVRTAQPLGNLIVYLLEPQSEDGLAAWNFLDAQIAIGEEYPIARTCNGP